MNALKDSILTTPESKVKVIFVPTYLNRADGIFDKDYYELLAGMDLTVFPSYYEPWGYTPLESVWHSRCRPSRRPSQGSGCGPCIASTWAEVIRRDDYNDREVEEQIADALLRASSALDRKHVSEVRVSAYDLSETALWETPFSPPTRTGLFRGGRKFVRTNRAVIDDGGSKTEQINFVRQQLFVEKPNWNRMMVR